VSVPELLLDTRAIDTAESNRKPEITIT